MSAHHTQLHTDTSYIHRAYHMTMAIALLRARAELPETYRRRSCSTDTESARRCPGRPSSQCKLKRIAFYWPSVGGAASGGRSPSPRTCRRNCRRRHCCRVACVKMGVVEREINTHYKSHDTMDKHPILHWGTFHLCVLCLHNLVDEMTL